MSDDTLDYIVLRSSGSATREVWGGSMGTMGTADAPQVTGEVLTLARRELPAVARDTNIEVLAPSMFMPLIEPFDAGTSGPAAERDMTTWGVRAIRAGTSPCSGEGVVVAVLDTGIDAAHPAFAGMELVQKDFTGTGNGNVHGHGTHCAATIFGRDVDGVIAVAALEAGPAGLRVADFSNTDATVSAPGVDVWSARAGGGLAPRSGTSMATPHVTGVAALWAEYLLRRGGFAPSRLTGKPAGTATKAGLAEGYDEFDLGAGLVQAPQEV